jgi:pimeloyl-ACP methyl ester carboxylesterase
LPELNGARFTPNARDIAVRSISTGPLLLFLPATGAVPRDYSAFLDTASSLGYHVLALDYWNLGLSVARTCGTDPVCYGDVVANRFDGSHAGIHSSVASNDSIVTRLTHALTVLHARDPAGGWERYLSGGRVRWNRLVLAGHSQGGGEAAYIAHRHRVQGVLMFASPVASDGTVVATWLSDRGATSIDRYYGLDDVHDVYLRRIEGSWAAMGLSGAEQSVAVNSGLPFVGGHRMLSNAELGTARQAHGRIVDDNGPRTKAGSPLFQPIWQWMLKAVRAPTASEHRPRTVS